MLDFLKPKPVKIIVRGLIVRGSDGKRVTEREYFHVIKTVGKKRYALRKNGEWFEIDKGGGLLLDCAFVTGDETADVWDI
jgi:hypothetical protein